MSKAQNYKVTSVLSVRSLAFIVIILIVPFTSINYLIKVQQNDVEFEGQPENIGMGDRMTEYETGNQNG